MLIVCFIVFLLVIYWYLVEIVFVISWFIWEELEKLGWEEMFSVFILLVWFIWKGVVIFIFGVDFNFNVCLILIVVVVKNLFVVG